MPCLQGVEHFITIGIASGIDHPDRAFLKKIKPVAANCKVFRLLFFGSAGSNMQKINIILADITKKASTIVNWCRYTAA